MATGGRLAAQVLVVSKRGIKPLWCWASQACLAVGSNCTKGSKTKAGKKDVVSLLTAWLNTRASEIANVEQVLLDVEKTTVPEISMLIVAEQRIRSLVEA